MKYILDFVDRFFSKKEEGQKQFMEFMEKLRKGNTDAKRIENITKVIFAEQIISNCLGREIKIKEFSLATNLSEDSVRRAIDEKDSDGFTRLMYFDIIQIPESKINFPGRGGYKGKGTTGGPAHYYRVENGRLQKIFNDREIKKLMNKIREELLENEIISEGINLFDEFDEEMARQFYNNYKDAMDYNFLDSYIIYKFGKLFTNPIYFDMKIWILNIYKDILLNSKKILNIQKDIESEFNEFINDLTKELEQFRIAKSFFEEYKEAIPTWILNKGLKETRKFSKFEEEVNISRKLDLCGIQIEELIFKIVEEINKFEAKWIGKFEEFEKRLNDS